MSQSNAKLPISVFIVCFNEEANIRRVLESCANMAEIVVVDSGSTDRTVEIAKQYTDRVTYNEWPGYAKQKAYAMSLCKNEWVLNLDADEELLPALVKRFAEVIEADEFTSVRSQRNDLFIDRVFSPLTKKPNSRRLYKKSKAVFDSSRLAHESADIEGRELFVKEVFHHYGYNEIIPIVDKNNLYSTLKAQEKYDKGKAFSRLKLLLVFPLVFIKAYLLQRFMFSGMRGFIQSVNIAHYAFLKEAKLYEHWQKKRL
ncbi:MAG: glycosyltransferase involved in cell wall biosynthesis [Gammaproteobacteria bacterium]|jgi:glycosyltransferase involved in cell wall biosynthesis